MKLLIQIILYIKCQLFKVIVENLSWSDIIMLPEDIIWFYSNFKCSLVTFKGGFTFH